MRLLVWQMVQPTGLECSPPHSAPSFSKWRKSLLKFGSSPVMIKIFKKNLPSWGWELFFEWCNRQDLNLWPPPSQGGVLIQLNYGCRWKHGKYSEKKGKSKCFSGNAMWPSGSELIHAFGVLSASYGRHLGWFFFGSWRGTSRGTLLYFFQKVQRRRFRYAHSRISHHHDGIEKSLR